MIGSFKQYLQEEASTVYFTFGRMNPPTVGHGKVMDTLARKAGKNPYKVYVSQSQDAKKNPLSYSDKVKHVRKMFPKHGRSVMVDKKVRTVIDALVALYNQGFANVVMVVGSDRVRDFDILLNKYNGVKARHGFYNFQSIKIASAGARDPDAEGVEGMSASKQRENASNNDFMSFVSGTPKAMNNKDARRLFNDVRKGMGLKEEKSFKNHVNLKTKSETREQYVKGALFELGDKVTCAEGAGTISWLGANYVMIEMADGTKARKWLHDVKPFNEATASVSKGDPVKATKQKISKEKSRDKVKHVKMIQRAQNARATAKLRTYKNKQKGLDK